MQYLIKKCKRAFVTSWHSNRARDESDLAARAFIVTRSLARDGMPGRPREQMPPPARGGPAARLWRLERRGVAPVSRPAMREHRQNSRTRMGAPVGKIHHRSVSERQVGTIAPRRLGDRVVTDEGSPHADPAIPRPRRSSGRRLSRGCHQCLRSRFRLSAISGPRRAGPGWAGGATLILAGPEGSTAS